MKKSKYIIHHYNPKLKNRARQLRKNMTEAEVKLFLKKPARSQRPGRFENEEKTIQGG